MSPEIVIPVIAAIGAGFLVVPSIVFAATGTRRSAACPDNGDLVQLRLGRRDEVKRLFTGCQMTVCACTRWPEKAGCDQACVRSV